LYASKTKVPKLNENSDLHHNTVPIKVVDKTLMMLQKKIVKGKGITSTIVGIPLPRSRNNSAKKVWRVLLDSGSDGDLLFVHKSEEDKRDCIYTKERFAAQRWRTSIGTFSTLHREGRNNEDAFSGVLFI
jgi:hypothetical protein